MHVTYPKYKLGDEVVREVAVPPTYGELKLVIIARLPFVSMVHFNCACLIIPLILLLKAMLGT